MKENIFENQESENFLSEHQSNNVKTSKTIGIWSPFWLVLKVCMGTTILTLPYFSYYAGNLWVTICTLSIITSLNFYTSYKLICTAELMNYHAGSTRQLAVILLGKFGLILNEISLFAQCFIAVTMFTSAASTCLQYFVCDYLMIESGCINYKYYSVIPLIIIWTQVMLLRKSHHYTIFGVIAGTVLIILIIIQLILSILEIKNEGKSDYPTGFSFKNFLFFYAAALFAVEGNMIILTLRYDSSRPSDFKLGMEIAYATVFLCYMLTSTVVPYALGSSINEISFLSFDSYPFLIYIGFLYIACNIMYVSINFYPYFYSIEQSPEFKKLTKVFFFFIIQNKLLLRKNQKKWNRIKWRSIFVLLAYSLIFLGDSVTNTLAILSGLLSPFSFLVFPVNTAIFLNLFLIQIQKIDAIVPCCILENPQKNQLDYVL